MWQTRSSCTKLPISMKQNATNFSLLEILPPLAVLFKIPLFPRLPLFNTSPPMPPQHSRNSLFIRTPSPARLLFHGSRPLALVRCLWLVDGVCVPTNCWSSSAPFHGIAFRSVSNLHECNIHNMYVTEIAMFLKLSNSLWYAIYSHMKLVIGIVSCQRWFQLI